MRVFRPQINRNHPLNHGLVAWLLTQPWMFTGDRVYGLAGDEYAFWYDHFAGDSRRSFAPTTRPYAHGELAFDGIKDWLRLQPIPVGDTFTISLWVQAGFPQPGGYSALLTDPSTGNGLYLFTQQVNFYQSIDRVTDATVPDGKWFHVICIAQGTQGITILVDGALQTGPDFLFTVGSYTFGDIGDDDFADQLAGSVDDLRLYNRALSVTEAQDLYALSALGNRGLLRARQKPWAGSRTPGPILRRSEPAQFPWQAQPVILTGPPPPPRPPAEGHATSPLGFPIPTRWTIKPPVGAQIDWRHPHSQDLEMCYLFNEGQGNIIHDLSGHGHDAWVGLGSGDALWTQWVTEEMRGRPGPALRGLPEPAPGIGGLDAVLGNLTTPIRFLSAQSWTLELWVYRTGVFPINATFGYIFYPASGAGPVQVNYGSSFIQFFDNTINVAVPAALGRWNHVVFSKHARSESSAQFRTFLNGQVYSKQLTTNIEVLWNKFLRSHLADPIFTGIMGVTRLWNRSMDTGEALDLYQHPYAMIAKRKAFYRNQRPPLAPSFQQWQVQPLRIPRIVLPQPAQVQWQAQAGRLSGVLRELPPLRMRWRTNLFNRALTIEPARLKWRSSRQILPVGLFLRDCGEEYETALQRTAIAGDWLIAAPAIDLYLSMNYNAGGFYEHRILDISDIEVNAPPGGGIASVANVTLTLAETGSGQSIVQLWEQASAVGAVEVTIDFLLQDASYVLRIFTGNIDSITVKDAVATLVLTDASIHHNLLIPKELVTVEAYPNADQAALTKPIPLVYGQGSLLGGCPLLLVDVSNNVYLVAAHPMQLGGKLAVYDPPTQTFLTLDSVVFIPNNGTAMITLGTINTANLIVTDPLYGPAAWIALDGNSATYATVPTPLAGPGYDSAIQIGDGWGAATWGYSVAGYPLATTLKIDITNHRRAPGSDPTTTGTFYFRTVAASAPTVVEGRRFMVSPAFNHVTSAHHNTFILSNVAVGVEEIFQVLLITRCQGTIGNASQVYHVGELSVTPLVAFSANVNGRATAVGIPLNIQELRFNRQRHQISVHVATGVANPTLVYDGHSLTGARIYTSALDSNLDGYGELIVTTDPLSAQRGNNTVSIDLQGHRRVQGSDPTVTGTFYIQTYNTATGTLLRDSLFTTEAFRHTLTYRNTSYTATAINLGANIQLAVRAVARNEGGAGNINQAYDVGEIQVETFYQPRGDSSEVFLFGAGYEGRTDTTGTVTDYLGSTLGRLYQTPDQVIASFYEEELGLSVDLPSFATAHNFYAGLGLRFDGGLGAGWAVEQGNARDILDALARQAMAILFPAFDATWGIRPFRTDLGTRQDFDGSSILCTEGAEGQRAEDRSSTLQLTMGKLVDTHNHFEVRYKYNTGSKKYDRVYKVTKDGSNLPDSDPEKAATEFSVYTSWLRYATLEPLIVEAYWIADDATAAHYLHHLVAYFSQQRLTVDFETTFRAACLQVGDFITVTDNSLPSGDNGGVFEIHTLRYRPLKGRIQIVASRVSSIPDVGIPPPPTPAVGCARFEDFPALVEGWDFEELSGDRIGHRYETVLTPVNTPLGVPGKVGTAIGFRRANLQYLDAREALSGVFTGAFTLACWIRLRSVPTDWGAFVCNDAPGRGYPYREIFAGVGVGGAIHVGVGYANTGGLIPPTVGPGTSLPFTNTDADWTLVRIWRTWEPGGSGVLGLQLNNGTITTAAFSGAIATAQNGCFIGAGAIPSGAGYHGDFDMDQLLIWRRVLNDDEWDALWNNGNG